MKHIYHYIIIIIIIIITQVIYNYIPETKILFSTWHVSYYIYLLYKTYAHNY